MQSFCLRLGRTFVSYTGSSTNNAPEMFCLPPHCHLSNSNTYTAWVNMASGLRYTNHLKIIYTRNNSILLILYYLSKGRYICWTLYIRSHLGKMCPVSKENGVMRPGGRGRQNIEMRRHVEAKGT